LSCVETPFRAIPIRSLQVQSWHHFQNPIGTILSVAMFRYSLNLAHEAKIVEDAVRAAIDAGLRTKDMGGSTGTAEAGDAIVAELVKILKA
jgi:3-isopropylmalate dehydrogenase